MKKILSIFLFCFLLANLHAQRGRVQIQDGTLVTDWGTLLHGALDRNYYRDFDWEDHKQDIRTIKEYGLNCIHMYMGGAGSEDFESELAYYDSIVSWTRDESLYLVMTPSWKGPDDEPTMTLVNNFAEFWSIIADRYKDETHLIFEIANEPQLYNAPYDSLTLLMEKTVYDTIRKYAPETHIQFMSYAININADSAIMDIKSLGDDIDWSNASISAHGYVYSAESNREFIHALQDSGYAVTITECPSVGNGWTNRFMNMSFLRSFEEDFISSLHHINLKQILEFPEGFISQIESSDLRWHPDFGNWPESLTEIDYINPYQPIEAGFNDEGCKIHRFGDSVYMYGIEDGGYVAYYNLDFDNETEYFSIVCAPASENWGNVEIHLDSLNGPLAGTCNLPRTAGWYDTKTYSCPVSIPEGIHNIYLVFYSDNWHVAGMFKSIHFVKNGVNKNQPPYQGSAFTIPGKIEAEEYDIGSRNISYHDNTAGNAPNYFRFDDVDIEPTTDVDSGYDVGYIESGEWLEYTINCSQEALTDMQFRVACTEAGEKIRVKINGDTLGTVYVPNTGDWQNWETVILENVSIPAGENQIFRLEFLEDGFNLNWIDFALFTDIRESKEDKFITFYPNPAYEYLTVQSPKGGTLEIYSMQGQLLYSKKLDSTQLTIPIDQLNPGNYIIKLVSQIEVNAEILIIE